MVTPMGTPIQPLPPTDEQVHGHGHLQMTQQMAQSAGAKDMIQPAKPTIEPYKAQQVQAGVKSETSDRGIFSFLKRLFVAKKERGEKLDKKSKNLSRKEKKQDEEKQQKKEQDEERERKRERESEIERLKTVLTDLSTKK